MQTTLSQPTAQHKRPHTTQAFMKRPARLLLSLMLTGCADFRAPFVPVDLGDDGKAAMTVLGLTENDYLDAVAAQEPPAGIPIGQGMHQVNTWANTAFTRVKPYTLQSDWLLAFTAPGDWTFERMRATCAAFTSGSSQGCAYALKNASHAAVQHGAAWLLLLAKFRPNVKIVSGS